MPHSAVSRIELNQNNTINIIIDVDGFDKGTPIEISGQVIQDNGAVGTFYSVQEFPVGPGKTATMTVPSISAVRAEGIRGRISHHGSCASSGSLDHPAG